MDIQLVQHHAAGQLDRQVFFLRGADRQRLGEDIQRAVVLVHPPFHLQRHIAAVHHRLRKLDALSVVQLHRHTAGRPVNMKGAKPIELHDIRISCAVPRVRLRRALHIAAVRRGRLCAGRQCQRHDQRHQQRNTFFHMCIPHFRSFSQIVISPASRVRSMSMTRWFRLPRNWREMSFSSLTNRPSTSTLMQASSSSVTSHRG